MTKQKIPYRQNSSTF